MHAKASAKATVVKFLLVGIVVLGVPTWAAAQGPGVRGGASIDPDQFYVGVHYETEALADRVHFRPNVEAGFGNDLTLVAGNFDFVYKFPRRNGWSIYTGGGPAVNFYRFDRGNADDVTETEAGLNVLLGLEHSEGLFFEVKVGALDSPEIKFGIGWTFR
jgi:hypothetical protein